MLRRQLELLTSEGFALLPLAELVNAIAAGRELPPRTVVITVDDGYEDFASAGAPVFREFGVPVTMFLTTGFLDGQVWMWWDRLEAALMARRVASVEAGGSTHALPGGSDLDRRVAIHELAQRLERLPTVERESAMAAIFTQVDWTSPATAPVEFAPMTWEQVRALEAAGTQFGAHTVTHPILALSSDEQSRDEIARSHARVLEELKQPVAVLAYPNGDIFARGEREAGFARGAGLAAAVTMSPRFVTPRTVAGNMYGIPRVATPEDFTSFLQLVAGPEALRHLIRGLS